jgi:hsp70-interacting protein
MDKLLQWSIALQSGDKETMAKVGTPDPQMLLQLFGGGPDEPQLMKHAMAVAANPEATAENRLVALENFEMLIENLDNANNIENLRLWPDVIALLDEAHPAALRALAALIVGIAVQNNPALQEAFLRHREGLRRLIAVARPEVAPPREVYLKALFALLLLLRNDAAACRQFSAEGGWLVVTALGAADGDPKTRLRLLLLVLALLLTGVDETPLRQMGAVELLAHILGSEQHTGCIDKVLNIVATLGAAGYKFSDDELAALRRSWAAVERRKHELLEDDWLGVERVVA